MIDGSQSVNFGGLFVGIGILVFMLVLSYLFWQLARMYRFQADKENKYCLLEELNLDKIAKKKGFDLEKEMIKRETYRKKSFRKRVEQEVYEEMFGKEKDDK
jgi:hypothetical protein